MALQPLPSVDDILSKYSKPPPLVSEEKTILVPHIPGTPRPTGRGTGYMIGLGRDIDFMRVPASLQGRQITETPAQPLGPSVDEIIRRYAKPQEEIQAVPTEKPVTRIRTPLSPVEEQQFQSFYAEQAKKLGLNPNPDDPLQKYDYRGAWKAGAIPSPETQFHWPSEFKDADHPNRFVGGIDTITGKPAPLQPEEEEGAITEEQIKAQGLPSLTAWKPITEKMGFVEMLKRSASGQSLITRPGQTPSVAAAVMAVHPLAQWEARRMNAQATDRLNHPEKVLALDDNELSLLVYGQPIRTRKTGPDVGKKFTGFDGNVPWDRQIAIQQLEEHDKNFVYHRQKFREEWERRGAGLFTRGVKGGIDMIPYMGQMAMKWVGVAIEADTQYLERRAGSVQVDDEGKLINPKEGAGVIEAAGRALFGSISQYLTEFYTRKALGKMVVGAGKVLPSVAKIVKPMAEKANRYMEILTRQLRKRAPLSKAMKIASETTGLGTWKEEIVFEEAGGTLLSAVGEKQYDENGEELLLGQKFARNGAAFLSAIPEMTISFGMFGGARYGVDYATHLRHLPKQIEAREAVRKEVPLEQRRIMRAAILAERGQKERAADIAETLQEGRERDALFMASIENPFKDRPVTLNEVEQKAHERIKELVDKEERGEKISTREEYESAYLARNLKQPNKIAQMWGVQLDMERMAEERRLGEAAAAGRKEEARQRLRRRAEKQIKIPGMEGEFPDENAPEALQYLADTLNVDPNVVAKMPRAERRQLLDNPEMLRERSARELTREARGLQEAQRRAESERQVALKQAEQARKDAEARAVEEARLGEEARVKAETTRKEAEKEAIRRQEEAERAGAALTTQARGLIDSEPQEPSVTSNWLKRNFRKIHGKGPTDEEIGVIFENLQKQGVLGPPEPTTGEYPILIRKPKWTEVEVGREGRISYLGGIPDAQYGVRRGTHEAMVRESDLGDYPITDPSGVHIVTVTTSREMAKSVAEKLAGAAATKKSIAMRIDDLSDAELQDLGTTLSAARVQGRTEFNDYEKEILKKLEKPPEAGSGEGAVKPPPVPAPTPTAIKVEKPTIPIETKPPEAPPTEEPTLPLAPEAEIEKAKIPPQVKDLLGEHRVFFEGVLPSKLPGKRDKFDVSANAGEVNVQPIEKTVKYTDDPRKQLADVVTTREDRPPLRGIHFRRKITVPIVEATNGSIAVILPTREEHPDNTVIDAETGDPIEGPFPNFDQIIPDTETKNFLWSRTSAPKLAAEMRGLSRANQFVTDPNTFLAKVQIGERTQLLHPDRVLETIEAFQKAGINDIEIGIAENTTIPMVIRSPAFPAAIGVIMPMRQISEAQTSKTITLAPELKKTIKIAKIGSFKEIDIPKLSKAIEAEVESGVIKDNDSLKRAVERAYGLAKGYLSTPSEDQKKYTHKDAQEAVELALVNISRRIVQKGLSEKETFEALKALYASQPNLNVRTSVSVAGQKYSTPAPYAYLAGLYAGLPDAQSALDTSAGNGMLEVARGPNTHVQVSDIDPDRIKNLQSQTSQDKNFHVAPERMDATLGRPELVGMDSIILNPPFGTLKEPVDIDGYQFKKMEHVQVARALASMADNGRAAFIIGGEMIPGADMERSAVTFFNWLYNHYNVVRVFDISGKVYARQGTTFPTWLVLINGRKATPEGIAPQAAIGRIFNKGLDDVFNQYMEDKKNELLVRQERYAGREPAVAPVGPAEAERPAEGRGVRGVVSGQNLLPITRPPGEAGIRGPVVGVGAGEGERGIREGGVQGGERAVVPVENAPPPIRGLRPAGGEGEVVPEREEGAAPPTGAELGGRVGLPPGEEHPGAEKPVRPEVATAGIAGTLPIGIDIEKILKDAGIKADDFKDLPPSAPTTTGQAYLAFAQQGFDQDLLMRLVKAGRVLVFEKGIKDYAQWAGIIHKALGDKSLAYLPNTWAAIYRNANEKERQGMTPFKAIMGMDEDETKALFAGDPKQVAEYKRRIAGGTELQMLAPATEKELKEESTSYKIPYQPHSKGPPTGTLIPFNLAQYTYKTLDEIQKKYGDIDKYVAGLFKTDIEHLFQAFSADQIDGLAMVMQHQGHYKAAIVGDDTGTGKGRIASGMGLWYIDQGKVPIFVTADADLFTDIYRDLKAVCEALGRKLPVPFVTNDENIMDPDTGGREILFSKMTNAEKKMFKEHYMEGLTAPFMKDKQIILTTYKQVQNEKSIPKIGFLGVASRNGAIIMDESHEAAGPESNRGAFFRGIILEGNDTDEVPAEYVTYLSATFSKRPETMAIYARTILGMSPIPHENLVQLLETGGVPVQEWIAEQLAKAGQLIRRERDFSNVKFGMYSMTVGMGDVEREKAEKELEKKINLATGFMRDIWVFSRDLAPVLAEIKKEIIREIGGTMTQEQRERFSLTPTTFGSIAHNFISQMLLSARTDRAVEETIKHLKLDKDGKPTQKVILTVQNTMETILANMGVKEGDQIPDNFLLSLKRGITSILKYHYRDAQEKKHEASITRDQLRRHGGSLLADRLIHIEESLENTNIKLPLSPLDVIREKLESKGIKVVEATGRSVKLVEGIFRNRTAAERNTRSITDRFNNGDIDVIIGNAVIAMGRSLHAAKEYADQRTRIMLSIQPHLNIDTQIQLFGRVNRFGQVVPPEIYILSSHLPAELRPTAVLKKKMETLNAETTAKGFGNYTFDVENIFNKYGDEIMYQYFSQHPEIGASVFVDYEVKDDGKTVPSRDKDGFAQWVTGRMAIMPVNMQNDVWDSVLELYRNHIDELDAKGQNDLVSTHMDLRAKQLNIEIMEPGARDPSNGLTDSSYLGKYLINNPHRGLEAVQVRNLVRKNANATEKVVKIINEKAIPWARSKDVATEKAVWIPEKRKMWYGVKPQTPKQIEEAKKTRTAEAIIAIRKNMAFISETVDEYGDVKIPIFRIGHSYMFIRGAEEYKNAILVNVTLNEKAPNPGAASNIFLHFAMPGGAEGGILKVSLSSIDRTPVTQSTEHNSTNARKLYQYKQEKKIQEHNTLKEKCARESTDELLREWDTLRGQEKVEAQIITGNILLGMSDMMASEIRTKVINFTMEDGSIDRGILIPATHVIDTPDIVTVTKDVLLRLIGDDKIRQFQTGPAVEVRWGRTGSGNITVNAVRGSKDWIKNDALRRLLSERQGFTKVGSAWEATFPVKNLGGLIDFLDNEFHAFKVPRNALPTDMLGERGALGQVLPFTVRETAQGTPVGYELPPPLPSLMAVPIKGPQEWPEEPHRGKAETREQWAFRIELPQLIKIAKALMGINPRILEKIRIKVKGGGGKSVLGVFRPKKGFYGRGTMEIMASLYRDPELAAKAVAHEISHVIDSYPTGDIKRHNNVIGRLASLIHSMKNELPKYVGAEKTYSDREIREELKNVTMLWSPWDPTTESKDYNEYRHSGEELYAEGLSVWLTAPSKLELWAPKFTQLLYSYLNAKPQVAELWAQVQDDIRTGKIEDINLDDIYNSFAVATETQKALAREQHETIMDHLRSFKQGIWSRMDPLHRLESEKRAEGKQWADIDDPLLELERMGNMASPVVLMLNTIRKQVNDSIVEAKLTGADFGAYLFFLRTTQGDRRYLANPYGQNGTPADKTFDRLQERLGPEKMAALEKIKDKFWAIRQTYVIPMLIRSGAYTEELLKHIQDNDNYCTFFVQKFLEDKGGITASGHIYKQIGTHEDITNPYDQTVIHDISLMKAAIVNHNKRTLINWMHRNASELIVKAKAIHPKEGGLHWLEAGEAGARNMPDGKAVQECQLMVVAENGKTQGYYVPKAVAELYGVDPALAQKAFHVLAALTLPIKSLLTAKNPWWIIWNVQRDLKASAKQLPKAGILKMMWYSIASLRDAALDAFLNKQTQVVQEMMQQQILGPSGFNWVKVDDNWDTELDREFKRYQLESVRGARGVADFCRRVSAQLDKPGAMFERMAKIAGYKYLKRNQDKLGLSNERIAHLVITRAGSPNFKDGGRWRLYYNNIWLFSSTGAQGIRSGLEAAQEDWLSYAFKTIIYNIMPTILMIMASLGYMGDWLKELFKKIPERDKMRRICIPLGLTPSGEAKYIVLPHDFMGEAVAAYVWNLIMNVPKGDLQKMTVAVHQDLPGSGMNPLINMMADVSLFLLNRNPNDDYWGNPIIDETTFKMGPWQRNAEAWKELGQHEFNSVFGTLLYRFPKGQAPVKEGIAELYDRPVLGPFLSRLVRVSKRGEKEALVSDPRLVAEKEQEAKDSFNINKVIEDAIAGMGNNPHKSQFISVARKAYLEARRDGKIEKTYRWQDFWQRFQSAATYRFLTPAEAAAVGMTKRERAVLRVIQKEGR